MFDSASTGTITHSCGDEPQETETWQLVETPAAGFAPADQAAFDARVVGKRIGYTHFISPGNVTYHEYAAEGAIYSGTHTYVRTGVNMGTLNLHYPEYRNGISQRCTVQLTFDTATTGDLTYSCSDGDGGSESWQLEEISGT